MNARLEAEKARPWADKVDEHAATMFGLPSFIEQVDELLTEHGAERVELIEGGWLP